MMSDARKCIESIKEVRKINNVNWMGILQLAIEYAPKDKIIPLLDGVDACDTAISKRFSRLISILKDGENSEEAK